MHKTAAVLSAYVCTLVLLAGCASANLKNTTALNDSGYTVVIIGGSNSTPTQLELLHKNFPGSVVIIPEIYYPLWLGSDAVLRKLREKGITGKLVLIGHSWGGLIAREIDGEHPNLAKAVVTIATPCGNFRYTPDALSGMVIRPQDSNSRTPLYIIGAYREDAAKRWWMTTEKSDGVVDIASVMAMGERAVNGSTVLEKEHNELLQDAGVIMQIKKWLSQTEDDELIAREVEVAKPILNNRKVALLRWSFMTGFFHTILLDLLYKECDMGFYCENENSTKKN